LINRQHECYYRYINEGTETILNTLIDIFISSSFDLEIINTSNETKSSSNSNSSSILSSFIAAIESSSMENKDKSDKDIETKKDNMSLNN
jgi:hypothetical protein